MRIARFEYLRWPPRRPVGARSPGGDRLVAEPDRDVATGPQAAFVLRPVPDVVASLVLPVHSCSTSSRPWLPSSSPIIEGGRGRCGPRSDRAAFMHQSPSRQVLRIDEPEIASAGLGPGRSMMGAGTRSCPGQVTSTSFPGGSKSWNDFSSISKSRAARPPNPALLQRRSLGIGDLEVQDLSVPVIRSSQPHHEQIAPRW